MEKWDQRFMELTEEVGTWASCLRRKVGAVIVKGRRVMATGYNGAPTGIKSCIERGKCLRIEQNIPSGTTPNSATPPTPNRTPSFRRRSTA